jgi:hypothetical protein
VIYYIYCSGADLKSVSPLWRDGPGVLLRGSCALVCRCLSLVHRMVQEGYYHSHAPTPSWPHDKRTDAEPTPHPPLPTPFAPPPTSVHMPPPHSSPPRASTWHLSFDLSPSHPCVTNPEVYLTSQGEAGFEEGAREGRRVLAASASGLVYSPRSSRRRKGMHSPARSPNTGTPRTL